MLRKRAYIFSYKYGKFCTLEWQLSLVCASWQNTKRSSSKKPNCKFQQDALGDDEAQHQNCLSLCSLLRDDCSPLYDHGAWTVRENRFWNNTSEPLSPALRDKKKKRNKNESPTVKPLTMASNFWLLPTILQKYRLQEECQIAFEERFYERPKGRTTIKDSMKQNLEEV